jgi:hypothetical protein
MTWKEASDGVVPTDKTLLGKGFYDDRAHVTRILTSWSGIPSCPSEPIGKYRRRATDADDEHCPPISSRRRRSQPDS